MVVVAAGTATVDVFIASVALIANVGYVKQWEEGEEGEGEEEGYSVRVYSLEQFSVILREFMFLL